MDKIRIAVVDDHPIIREGVAELATTWEDVEVVATGASPRDALAIASTTLPDVLLLDYKLGRGTSASVCREISKSFPSVKIIVFTVFGDPTTVVEMVRAGAVGFMLKDSEASQLHLAIQQAARGESPIDPRVTATIVEAALAPIGSASGRNELDMREKKLLGMVALGLSNREIADRLFVSEKTVKNSPTKLYKKLGVSRRSEAAAIGVRHGYHKLVDDVSV